LAGPDWTDLVRGLVRGVVTDRENKIKPFRMGREQPLQEAQSRFSFPRGEYVGVFGNAFAGLALGEAGVPAGPTGPTPCRNAGG